MPRRPAMLAAAALAAVGLVLSVLLVREHATAHAGGSSFCALNAYVNCDRVATSSYSVFLGLPVAAWGVLGYGLELLLALAGLSPRRRHPLPSPASRGGGGPGASASWPAGLLFVVAALAVAAAAVLAGVSTLVIGALCLLCTGSWVVSLALLVAAWRGCRPGGVGAAVREDLALLSARKGQALVLLLAALALVAIARSAYPRYWQAGAKGAASVQSGAGQPEGAGSAAASTQGPLTVVVFSDYLCPACKRAHEETRALLAGRNDVYLARRQFPLDSDCNPVLKRRMHPGACDLARIGICAEGQGKLEPMEDLLFANQEAKRPVDELVRAAGLDSKKLQACLSSADTEARLRSDIESAVRIGLKGTPTFLIRGREYPNLPPALLPPRPATSAAK